MSTIVATNKLYKVDVFPTVGQYQDVVARAVWGIDYEEQGLLSRHTAQTLLRVDDITNFTPIEQLTKEQVIDWCIATEGGQAYLDQILVYHTQQLQWQIAQVGIVNYPQFPVDPLPIVVSNPTVPETVL